MNVTINKEGKSVAEVMSLTEEQLDGFGNKVKTEVDGFINQAEEQGGEMTLTLAMIAQNLLDKFSDEEILILACHSVKDAVEEFVHHVKMQAMKEAMMGGSNPMEMLQQLLESARPAVEGAKEADEQGYTEAPASKE